MRKEKQEQGPNALTGYALRGGKSFRSRDVMCGPALVQRLLSAQQACSIRPRRTHCEHCIFDLITPCVHEMAIFDGKALLWARQCGVRLELGICTSAYDPTEAREGK
ncbi:uncharacterized protein FOMMEDRAFT_155894 [Fomitiporia mediterranea MF3/22]|uniref:uncharacterized protein n=1 Tax=Fomitiporia mediterranea (strain MF3/22) TaxID=694068 RepID=UPI00044086E1|nr:uncharacterized protein FOMMEDRAFT_155894 [Fomitiporia mediterranea MF3/22]EJD02586.1 hypothetical protein FOMMEDRAFT_155894 [Fomitiporia mediterranea MF3/22]